MVDFFYNWYSLTYNIKFLQKLKIDAINRHLATITANLILPIYFKYSKYKRGESSFDFKKRARYVVASITTYPARIDRVWLAIESIMRQSVVPDYIVLWLSKEQFPNIEVLPSNLLALQDKGLKIEIRDEDLRSHKKYYYALKEYPNCDLFTFDDDIIYPSDAFEKVLQLSIKEPNSCVCRYSSQILIDKDDNVCWAPTSKNDVNVSSYNTFCGSGGGTLFPLGTLPPLVLDKDSFLKHCRTADDVWLNCMLRFNNVKVAAITDYCPLLSIINKDRSALFDVNQGEGNNTQLKDTRNYCKDLGFDIYNLMR